MWMINPVILCRQHLQGQHVECHMFAGSIKKRIDMKGYVDNNLLELKSLFWYHDLCAEEMLRRNYKHKSPLITFDFKNYINNDYILNSEVNKQKALRSLLLRCKDCIKNYETLVGPLDINNL
jgi:hypothetical protein